VKSALVAKGFLYLFPYTVCDGFRVSGCEWSFNRSLSYKEYRPLFLLGMCWMLEHAVLQKKECLENLLP
jgi:hypothetical protein